MHVRDRSEPHDAPGGAVVRRLAEELATLAVLASVAVLSPVAVLGDRFDVASVAALLAAGWLVAGLTFLVLAARRRVDETDDDRNGGP